VLVEKHLLACFGVLDDADTRGREDELIAAIQILQVPRSVKASKTMSPL